MGSLEPTQLEIAGVFHLNRSPFPRPSRSEDEEITAADSTNDLQAAEPCRLLEGKVMPKEVMDGLTGSQANDQQHRDHLNHQQPPQHQLQHQHSHPPTTRLTTHDDPRRPTTTGRHNADDTRR